MNEPQPDEVDAVPPRPRTARPFLLFVGTVEPRKNLARLIAAVASARPAAAARRRRGRRMGRSDSAPAGRRRAVPRASCPRCTSAALYAGAERVLLPEHLRRGSGCRSLEAMAQGTPVVTSRGTSTEEVAGGRRRARRPGRRRRHRRGIARGARTRRASCVGGRVRAAELTWARDRRAPPSPPTGRLVLMATRSASTCCGACPGHVGGSEEYLARQLLGLPRWPRRAMISPATCASSPTPFPTYAEAHPGVAEVVESSAAPVSGTSRARGSSPRPWLAEPHAPSIDLVHHGGGTVPAVGKRPAS